MNYIETMNYIEEAKMHGSVLGLQSMINLLNELHNPQDKLRFVHIAGTNGKGSTAAFTATILGEAKYKVGRYISPSVFHYEEKIQITEWRNGRVHHEHISQDDLCHYMSIVRDGCNLIVEKGMSHPTLFEIETALSFLYFVDKKIDIVVLEVGLGGRLDATNVVKTVECSVITSISMDHMEYLGDTIEKIAFEKAGIIKEHIPVVSYNQLKEVEKVLLEVCEYMNSTFHTFDEMNINRKDCNIEGSRFDFGVYSDLEISLIGRHQINNAILSLLVIEELNKKGYEIKEEDIRKGLKETRWRGRFEVIRTNPYFIIDGAHNEDAAIVLANNIEEYFIKNRSRIIENTIDCNQQGDNNQKIIYIIGVLKDKEYEKVLSRTASYASNIITITPNNIRGLDGRVLLEVAMKYCEHVEYANTVVEGIEKAYSYASPKDVIITFGSLSFLHEVLKGFGEDSIYN